MRGEPASPFQFIFSIAGNLTTLGTNHAAHCMGICGFLAARSGRNRTPMRTALRMPQKRANLISYLWGKNVFKLTGLLLDLLLILHGKSLRKQALCQTVTADHVCGPLSAAFS